MIKWLINLFRKLFRRDKIARIEVEPYSVEIRRHIKDRLNRYVEIWEDARDVIKKNRHTMWIEFLNGDIIKRRNRDVIIRKEV